VLKTKELVRSITSENVTFDGSTSVLNVRHDDTERVRKKILNVSYSEWKMGFSKGTLYYVKKNAKAEKPFSLIKHVRERVEQWEIKA
jgi:CRISPR-associated protein Cas1